MVYITKFRANDLNPSKGKQIEFNNGVAQKFFGFTADTHSVAIECRSMADTKFKKKITVSFKLSPARGDYKIYQNNDGSSDLKDVFLQDLKLTDTDNINDYYAIRKKSEDLYQLYYVPKGGLFADFFQIVSGDQLLFAEQDDLKLPTINSLQRITYGAPGTGKSWGIEERVKAIPDRVFRTTFHPDCDYSTFVGAYKPTMEDVAWRFVDKGKEAAVEGANGKPATEKKIVYKFVEQAFTKAYVKAWQAQAEAIAVGADAAEAVYLVIEEINRGNCAQVFGDIFQLLDRENGYSKYPVKADEDLRRHLKEAFDGLDFGAKYARVQMGEDLVLPNNLYILATMNTSDQSLFPMDSAFKRRWDWQYVPIKDGGKNWKIKFGDCEVDWWKFLLAVNKIVKSVTNSADKQLGYFFVKAKDAVIDAEMFVNKVAFYLWNDVFKDCELDGEAFKVERDGQADVLAFQDFFTEGGAIDEAVLKNFLTKLVPPPEAAQGGGATAAAGAAG